jgi:hypothetical protein
MSVDECSTVASNAAIGAADTVISPMHDGGGSAAPTVHAPTGVRGVDEVDSRAQPDSVAPHATHSTSESTESNRPHKGGGHVRTPWQSLLPGVMK